MIVEDIFTVHAPIETTWKYLLDPETIVVGLTDCEKCETLDERTYQFEAKQKAGPISVRIKGTAILTEVNPPTFFKAQSKGHALRNFGSFNVESTVHLEALSDNETRIQYRSDVRIVGKLAAFGYRILKPKAKQIQEELMNALQGRLLGLGPRVP
jgi:carbon monoxide dehydrogenase subunit G